SNDVYNKYLVTPDTVIGPFVQHIGSADAEPDVIGGARFTEDGTKYAAGTINSKVHVMDFDRCSGEFSNCRMFQNKAEPGFQPPGSANSITDGLCFSPSGRYLYITSLLTICQFDTWADTIENSKARIAMKDSTYQNNDPFFLLNLTPFNEIVIGNYQGTPGNYHLIHQPDSGGLVCQFEKEALEIPGSWDNIALPNIVNLQLGALPGSGCDTITSIVYTSSEVETEIRVFPNPCSDLIFIETKGYGTGGVLEITDATGRTQYMNASFDETTVIKVNNWPAGVYFWQLQQGQKKTGYGKLLVQH
ncbi:MAG TPA: T9SS type A sorting domain-containing protein, partial [Chitinophagales bacterium]|nr:T9SS type A sorting domain-containing protein [Chitinophagales bacterium]